MTQTPKEGNLAPNRTSQQINGSTACSILTRTDPWHGHVDIKAGLVIDIFNRRGYVIIGAACVISIVDLIGLYLPGWLACQAPKAANVSGFLRGSTVNYQYFTDYTKITRRVECTFSSFYVPLSGPPPPTRVKPHEPTKSRKFILEKSNLVPRLQFYTGAKSPRVAPE